MTDQDLSGLSREELLAHLKQARATLEALREGQADAIIGHQEPLVVKSHSAELVLEESEERLRLLFENLSQGVVFQAAVDHRVAWCNREAEEILGKSLEEMRARAAPGPLQPCIRQDGGEFPLSEHPTLKALHSGQAVRDVLMGVFNARERSRRWIRVDAVPLIRPGRQHPYLVAAFFSDVTEQVRAQKELERHHERLEEMIAQRTLDLTRKTEELQGQATKLEDLNAALRVLLDQRLADKQDAEGRMLSNLDKLVLPHLEELSTLGLSPRQATTLETALGNLRELGRNFSSSLYSRFSGLTPREIQVAQMVRGGRSSKEIAGVLGLSVRSVDSHRANLRQKLGLDTKGQNLRSFLLTLE